MQDILVYVTVLTALVYLFYKYIIPQKQKAGKKSACGKDDCGCH